jgi:drug/metabolite transporter (DMT)-like permease
MPAESTPQSNLWIAFALLTVATWGLYGVFLHSGKTYMADSINGGFKAFFWVGIAYFLIAVLAPAAMLLARGASWSMPGKGITWSLLAGTVGAIGAFGVLLAFGAKGQPAVVMSIIFAGAPIVNAVVSLSLHPPKGGFGGLAWQFYAGIVLAAAGGMLVTLYKPAPAAPPKTPPIQMGQGS